MTTLDEPLHQTQCMGRRYRPVQPSCHHENSQKIPQVHIRANPGTCRPRWLRIYDRERSYHEEESLVSAQDNPQATDCVALASGGLDSTTVLAICVSRGFRPLPLTFRYGQTHAIEIERVHEIAASLDLEAPLVLDVPFDRIGGSALLGTVPIPEEPQEGATSRQEIPATYVPARNLVFLSLAIAVAEARGLRDIWIGVNALDYSGYPDCRPEFLASFLDTAELGTREGSRASEQPWWRIQAPLVDLTKAQIIETATNLGVDLSLTLSCYAPDPQGLACGICDSCGLRRRGFEEAGIEDPTRYQIPG